MMFMSRILRRALLRRLRIRINNPRPNPLVMDCVVSRKRKIEQLNVDSEHEAVEKKRNTGNNEVNPDRISDLPDAIIHLIYSYIKCPKDVARTMVLSKKWKRNFNSYLNFDFDERWFCMPKQAGKHNRIKAREVQKKKFKSYVERSLRARLDVVTCMDKFRLYVNNFDKELQICMQRWVCSALAKNVKELDIQVDVKKKGFALPCAVLMSPLITFLKLSGPITIVPDNISMSNLRQLSIKESDSVTDSVIEHLETGCPLLEDLRLISCKEFGQLSISSLLKLKRVEVQKCVKSSIIAVAGLSLETFLYHGINKNACTINLTGSPNLKSFTLRDFRMPGMAFQEFITKHPLLEKLELQRVSNIVQLDIFSERLSSLMFVECWQLRHVNIDAPNLCNLEFSGYNMPFASVSSVNVSGLREAKFTFGPVKRRDKCPFRYPQLFRNFDRSKGFKLIVYSNQNMTMKIFDEPEDAYKLQNCIGKFELTASLTNVSKAVDKWLRESHGKNIILISPSTELIRATEMVIIEQDVNPSCCRMYSNKCWRHYIKKVSMSKNSQNEMNYNFEWKLKC